MDPHLSEMKIKELLDSKVTGTELLEIDAHLSECADCAERTAAVAGERMPVLGPAIDGGSDDHLPYETLESYLDSKLPDVEREIADVHMRVCEDCKGQFEDLSALRAELEAENRTDPHLPKPSEVQESPRKTGAGGSRAFWRFLVPAFGVVAVVIAAAFWYVNSGRESAGPGPVTSPVPTLSPGGSLPSPQASETSAGPDEQAVPTPMPEIAASLVDTGGKIEVLADGRITGLKDSRFEGDVRRALLEGKLTVDGTGSDLRQGSGKLMGPGEGVPFALSSPVGLVIEASAPLFRWSALEGAENYRVEVFDERFNKLIESPDLKGTEWRASKPLPRGQVLRWQVIAAKDGNSMRSPTRPAPDARFKVITSSNAKLIGEARNAGRSSLLLGIAYAKAGLLPEAEKEFSSLVRKNPNSSVARKLLQQVRSRR